MRNIEVNSHGTVFTSRAAAVMQDMADEMGRTIADRGVDTVRAEFAKFVQHPTGHYSSQIHRTSFGSRHVIDDGGMIYGPWLAGVGSRNKTSRFKGYAHWRRAAQILARSIPAVARGVLPRYIARLR